MNLPSEELSYLAPKLSRPDSPSRSLIFHEAVGHAATLGGELSQTRLCLRLNVRFRDCQFRDVD